MKNIGISIIIPMYSASKFVNSLIDEISIFKKKLGNCDGLFLKEVICVLDNPIDDTKSKLVKIIKEHDWVHKLELSKNFGQHPATVAGILHSSGDWIVTLDEDLQHHPRYIVPMLETLTKVEFDVCYGKAQSSTHGNFIKDKFAIFFKYIIRFMSANEHVQKFNSFRIMRAELARAAAAVCRNDMYYDIVLTWFTDRIISQKIQMVDIRNQEAITQSGYSWQGLVNHGVRMILSSKTSLSRSLIGIAFLAMVVCLGLVVYSFLSWSLDINTAQTRGWFSLILTITFFGSISTFFLGFILELLLDLLISNKGKPAYFIVDRKVDSFVYDILKDFDYDSQSL